MSVSRDSVPKPFRGAHSERQLVSYHEDQRFEGFSLHLGSTHIAKKIELLYEAGHKVETTCYIANQQVYEHKTIVR